MSINTTAAINARFAAVNFTYEANTDGYLVTNLTNGKSCQMGFFLLDIISKIERHIEDRKWLAEYEVEQARIAEGVANGTILSGEPVAEVAEVVEEPVAPALPANLTNYDIVTLAEVNGFRVSLQETGEWFLIRKADRMTVNIGYNLKDAVAIINPAPETFKQIEIERGYAAQEAEEHAAWIAEQEEEEVMTEDDDTMTVMMAAVVLRDRRTGDATEEEIDEAFGVMVRAVAAELRARGVTYYQDSLTDWIWSGEFDGDETAESLADEWEEEYA